MTESGLLKKIHLSITEKVKNCRLFRNNTGTGWQGNAHHLGTKMVINNPRPLNAGLCTGSSDFIGWTTVEITPDMVGHKIAVFTAAEVKTATGRVSKEQQTFLNVVRAAGGFAHLFRSETEAVDMLSLPPLKQIFP